MDLALNLTSSCRVRVLLVPVTPIKKSTFLRHVELVKQFSVVRLGDVTPDLQKGANAKFSSQVFQEGQMHFQFLTSYRRDHAHLEDFQPHRRIFGVIGIMDCQEWKDKNLSEGYHHFVNTLSNYPTAVATRCFAFDPTENQPDDTKGLIMIPNVGNLSFYMSTMICDFASEILSQFDNIASRIENLPMLESPLPRAHANAGYFDQAHTAPNPMLSPQPSASTPTGFKRQAPAPSPSSIKSPLQSPMAQQQPPSRMSQPPTPMPTQSTSSFLRRASTMTANSLSTSPPPMSKNGPLPPIPTPSLSRTNSMPLDTSKTKRRTPGRIKKLFADFYLLAGRLPDAVSYYQMAIEMTKSTSDFLWLASAMEGLACANLLLEYLQGDVGHIVSRKMEANANSADVPLSPTQSMEDISLKPAPSTFTDLLDQYTALIQYYGKVHTSATVPIPSLVYAEACIKVARLLLATWIHGGWTDQVLNLVVQGKLKNEKAPPPKPVNYPMPRFEIAEWVMRVWSVSLDPLPLLDQINVMTQMSTVLSTIGYQRKAAWCMHESIHSILPLLIQSRANVSNAKDLAAGLDQNGHGILQVLKHICDAYGIGEQHVQDGGALDAIDTPARDRDSSPNQTQTHHQATEQRRMGWALLQIDVLRQCIAISEALPDYGSMLYYTTVLLKNLYEYIPKDEQIRLASSIQRIVAMGKRSGRVESNVNYWGVNIVSHIEASQAIPRKAVYELPMLDPASVSARANGDPFIYNPFAQKKNDKDRVLLVKSELCDFKVTLTNPFGFDLELQHVILSTTGVSFTPVATSATIPAHGTVSLRLTGTPQESGQLTVRGCIIRIVGFAEQEFLYDEGQKKQQDQPSISSRHRDVVKYKYSGLQAIEHASKKQVSDDAQTDPVAFYNVQVIDDQPLLKMTTTSLLHGAVMLYEGEMTQIKMVVENIGHILVDFVTLSFTDSTCNEPINPELPMEQQYEMELFRQGMPVFSWEGTDQVGTASVGKKVQLAPGAKMDIIVKVYGKRGCSGGTIQIDYGYLDRQSTAQSLYTRQLYLPVLVSVYQNLEPLNWDVLYLRPHCQSSTAAVEERTNNDATLMASTEPQEDKDLVQLTQSLLDLGVDKQDYCLVTMDIRNTWTLPFDVTFKVNDQDSDDHLSLSIQPGWTKRVVLPVKRMFLSEQECQEPIPSLQPNKQYVVSQSLGHPEQERSRLQMFWYREKILEKLQAHWSCPSTKRHGLLHLRPSLRLSSSQLSILKKQDIAIIVNLQGPSVKSLTHRHFQCPSETFVSMQVTIHNRQPRPVKLILRVQPVQSYNNGAKEYDLSSKLLMQGLHQITMPEATADGKVTHVLPLCFLSRGRYEFLYHVEDVHTRLICYDHDWAIVDCQ
ncbi:Trs120-domain-containing protein [Hesseltinella vesiculosa]|uniref:Trs120-domain-containing protein n=1 Tax=Hesseltinella vesiculosa TaxID=101127 RepID=A0A1X2GHG5_9FUNG|nr:Trs120-domain-containing protein [Hesseltinella vesiculosa]